MNHMITLSTFDFEIIKSWISGLMGKFIDGYNRFELDNLFLFAEVSFEICDGWPYSLEIGVSYEDEDLKITTIQYFELRTMIFNYIKDNFN